MSTTSVALKLLRERAVVEKSKVLPPLLRSKMLADIDKQLSELEKQTDIEDPSILFKPKK